MGLGKIFSNKVNIYIYDCSCMYASKTHSHTVFEIKRERIDSLYLKTKRKKMKDFCIHLIGTAFLL